jgi:hypothetical protein
VQVFTTEVLELSKSLRTSYRHEYSCAATNLIGPHTGHTNPSTADDRPYHQSDDTTVDADRYSDSNSYPAADGDGYEDPNSSTERDTDDRTDGNAHSDTNEYIDGNQHSDCDQGPRPERESGLVLELRLFGRYLCPWGRDPFHISWRWDQNSRRNVDGDPPRCRCARVDEGVPVAS